MAHEEDDDCRLVVKLAENFWWSKYLFHVANGGRRKPIEASRLVGIGVRKGVPDFVLALPSGRFSGLYIEMKSRGDRGTRGKPAVEQLEYQDRLASVGYCAVIAYGFDAAYAALIWYTKDAERPAATVDMTLNLPGPDGRAVPNKDLVMRGRRS